jgi:glyoxalase family protein
MPSPTPGIHHVTAVASDPGPNYEFYTDTLGLRLVKRSVNQDDTSVYHLFYADDVGSPGTSMTFFPYPDARPGQVGTGQVTTTQFSVPAGSIDYWVDRLVDAGVDADEPFERFGDTVVPLRDPDGLQLELVADGEAPAEHPPDGPVPAEHAIRGFFGVTLSLTSARSTAELLETMGYRQTGEDRDRQRYETDADLASVVDLREDPNEPRGQPGAGTVHHVAYQVTTDDQPQWRETLIQHGLRATQIIDRKWFHSVYARTPGGVLFEWATKEPGYTVDEDLAELGEKLVLPEWFDDQRETIESQLPPLE